jgi:hypothetical protein
MKKNHVGVVVIVSLRCRHMAKKRPRPLNPDGSPSTTHAATKLDLAAALGKTVQSLDRYISLGMPLFGPPYDIDGCRVWIRENVQSRSRDDDTQGDPLTRRRLKWQTRKFREDARAKRMKNDQVAGRLLDTDEVKQWIAERFLRIKERLEAMPNELQVLAPSSIRATFREDIEKAVHRLLLEMSSWEAGSPGAAAEESA